MVWESVPGTPAGALPADTGESVSLCGERRDSTGVSVGEDLQGNTVRGGEDTVTPALVIMGDSVITQR